MAADVIHIEIGRFPWAPSRDSELVDVINYYDWPLEGIIEQHSTQFLFRCISGEGERASLWVYGAVSDRERGELAEISMRHDELAQVVITDQPLGGGTRVNWSVARD